MKEQIEEMRDFMLKKSNSANVEPVFTTSEGQEIVLGKDLTKLLNDVLEQAFIPFLAEALYSADYRKQSEGEWIFDTKTHRFYCSNCQWNDGNKYYFNGVKPQYKDFDYCPKCGARMKGADNERRTAD